MQTIDFLEWWQTKDCYDLFYVLRKYSFVAWKYQKKSFEVLEHGKLRMRVRKNMKPNSFYVIL